MTLKILTNYHKCMEPTHEKYAFSRSLIAISLLALFSSGASAAEKITLKLAHNLERSHVVHQAFEEMAKEVNQLSDGNMKIRIYPSSQMGSARETMELLQMARWI